ncbi:hypothetical protein L207DRAFT_73133 [Hyaloscypha variabilis F]|uniref:Uncharacterized protein n=1 Tax=Hyaloscypha variabilis (strain UAMH 11265 / GT02V1 / F) TaxID=1149755 RepID=A0A2J6RFK9_HYAVF|nr:hypothetical protein L207DRAFT_73133 [Hyaloscypha variabilis F]
MVLDIDWDKALLERLQPAKDPANHKRSTTDDLLISLPQHHQFTTTSDSVDFAIQREQRSKSEEPTLEACARQARPRYPDDASHLPVEHDDSEMPSKRSHGRKRTHSVSQEDIVDLSNDTAPALLESPEPEGRKGGEAVATDISSPLSFLRGGSSPTRVKSCRNKTAQRTLKSPQRRYQQEMLGR